MWPGYREAGSALRRPPGPCDKYRADRRPARQLLGALAGPSVPWTAIASFFQPLLTLHVSGTVPGAGRSMASEARHRPGTAGPPRPRPDIPSSRPADARGRMTLGHGVVLCTEGSLAASLASPDPDANSSPKLKHPKCFQSCRCPLKAKEFPFRNHWSEVDAQEANAPDREPHEAGRGWRPPAGAACKARVPVPSPPFLGLC